MTRPGEWQRGDYLLRLHGSIFLTIAVTLILAATILFACSAAPVWAHLKNQPSLDQWLDGLASRDRGGCCDKQEAETMADPDWKHASEFPGPKGETCVASDPKGAEDAKMAVTEFCVRLENPRTHEWTWWTVPAGSIVEGANRAGPALIWAVWIANNRPYIRCFMPGALS